MHHPGRCDTCQWQCTSTSDWLEAADGERRGCRATVFGTPLITRHPWPVRWTGTGADQALWRSQSSATDKAIMLLLSAFRAVIKCDRDCPAASPTGRQWGVHQQQIMTGEATPMELWHGSRFGCKNLATGCRASNQITLCLQAKSSKVSARVSVILDTCGNRAFAFPGVLWGKLTIFCV